MLRIAVVLLASLVVSAPSAEAGCCQTTSAEYPCFNADPPDQSYCEGSMWYGTFLPQCTCNVELIPRRCVPASAGATCGTSGGPTTTVVARTTTTTIDVCQAPLLNCGPVVITTSNPLLLLNAPLPGRLLAQLATASGARLAQARATVLARGKAKVRAAGPVQLTLKLTKKGKRFVRSTPSATADLTVRLIPKGGGSSTVETRAVALQP